MRKGGGVRAGVRNSVGGVREGAEGVKLCLEGYERVHVGGFEER